MHASLILAALFVNLSGGLGAFSLGASSKDEKFDFPVSVCANVALWACGEYQSLNLLERIKCMSSHNHQIGNLCAFRLLLQEASLSQENDCWQTISSSCFLKDEDSVDSFFDCFKSALLTTGSLGQKCQGDENNKNAEETLVQYKSQTLLFEYQTKLSNIEGVKPAHHGDSLDVDVDPYSPFSTKNKDKKEKKNCRELSDKHADIRLPECEDSSPFHFWDRAFVVGFILGGVALLVRYIRKENQLKDALLPHRAAASELLSESERSTNIAETASNELVEDQTPAARKSMTETIV